jgi:D-serine deaminase-like pyridoxal phosphate-dependent protein
MIEERALPLALASAEPYRIADVARVRTPALAIYPAFVEANIATTIRLLGGDPARWRAHVKTAKLAATMRQLVEHGVTALKCATTLELRIACESGARDVLVAYPLAGANVRRVRELAGHFADTHISALVDDPSQLAVWQGSRVGAFIDVNPGMDRTGIAQKRTDAILGLARAIANAGLELRGLHYYDGHLAHLALHEREAVAHRGYDRLLDLVTLLGGAGIPVREVVTAGTPAFPCTLSYAGFRDAPFLHRASPGTVVYSDATSLAQLPEAYGYRPAAVVLATVVSHPAENRVTCDAGHKTVSADAGDPTCAVLGRLGLRPLHPSEEHLPLEVAPGERMPPIGETHYLAPRHVCPTVNNFDHALIIEDGAVARVEPVSARGREAPLDATTA